MEDIGDVLSQIKPAKERVAHFDVDVDIGQGFQFGIAAFFCVVGVFQQFYPKAKAADIDGVGVEIHAEEAVFDDSALLIEESFLDALALLIAGDVAHGIAVLVGYKEFIVLDVNAIVLFLDALAGAVNEDAEVVFGADDFVEGGYQEVAGTYSWVTYANGIYNSISPGIVFDVLVFQGLVIFAGPTHLFVEAVHYGLPDGLATHIHRDGAGGEHGTVMVTVDFLEDESQHGGIDKGLGLFLHFLGALTGKVIGIQELQHVAERWKFGVTRFLTVFEYRAAEQGQFTIVQAADADGLALQRADLEERAIEVRTLPYLVLMPSDRSAMRLARTWKKSLFSSS